MGRGRGLPITSGDPNVPDEYGDMALVGAARSGQVGVIRVLLAHGAKTGIQDGFGWLPLSAAASRGHVEAVEVLVKEGKADIDAQAQDRLTALMWAARAGRLEVIRCLLKLGANLDLRRDARDDDDPEDAEWTARRHGKEDAANLPLSDFYPHHTLRQNLGSGQSVRRGPHYERARARISDRESGAVRHCPERIKQVEGD